MGEVRKGLLFALPTLNRYEGACALLDSVERGTVLPEMYVIVDNGGGFVPFLEAKMRQGIPSWVERTRLYQPAENVGVAPSWNLALELGFPWTVIGGDDCLVNETTLEALLNAAEARPEFGLYSPVVEENKPHSEWSFFMQSRDLTEKLGLYDEIFWPGYFEDDDYRRRMRLAGTMPAKVLESKVQHIGGATSEQFAWSVRYTANQERYAAKWGGIPGQETVAEPPAPVRRPWPSKTLV